MYGKYLFLLVLFGVTLKTIINQAHLMQLESYYIYGFIKRNPFKKPFFVYEYYYLVFDLLSIILYYAQFPFHYWFALFILLFHFYTPIKKEKRKALVYTGRVKRLIAVTIAIIVTVLFLPIVPFMRLLSPIIIIIAHFCVFPFEWFIRRHYKIMAKNKLIEYKNKGTKIIGITGSYGKTSVKYILSAIMASEYEIAFTPASYNTPMGISLFVNTRIPRRPDFLIIEMGARHRGDIKEVCELAMPDIGVITAIGPQHMETFGSIKNILRTKTELYDYVLSYGETLFYNNCNNILKDFLQDKEKAQGILCNEFSDFSIKDISLNGMIMDIIIDGKKEENIKTALIGKANAINITLAANIAYKMGIKRSKIVKAIEKIMPVEHRLQVLPDSGTGIRVIDDAFNANIEGIKNAADTLKRINAKRKIIITPGIVESGKMEYEMNKEVGTILAEVADKIYLVKGRGTKRVEGLIDGIADNCEYTILESMLDFQKVVAPYLQRGDVLLFENDIPDNW